MSALDRIKKQVEESPVILYMKGTPQMPMCGFSARTVEALKSCGKEFAYVNVILDSEIMQESNLRTGLHSHSYISRVIIGG